MITFTLSREDAALLLMLAEHAAEDTQPAVAADVERLIDMIKRAIETETNN